MQFISLTYNEPGRCWEANSRLRESQYHVCGPSPSAALREICQLLNVPADRWRITVLNRDAYRCEYSPPDEVPRGGRSTVDFEPVDPNHPPLE